jgi:TatD DNase family protein
MIGLNGCGLKTTENCAAAALIPLDRLLLETDAPWCSIKPTSPAYKFTLGAGEGGGTGVVKREKFSPGCLVKDRNEPSLTPLVALAFAGLTGVPVELVAKAAEENVRRLVGKFMAEGDVP